MATEIFDSAARTAGDLVGIFECNSSGGYFYLFDLTQERGQQARAAIRVNSGDAGIQASDVSVRWNAAQDTVGLYIGDKLWAAFDQHGRKYGGDYDGFQSPGVPRSIVDRFSDIPTARELRAC